MIEFETKEEMIEEYAKELAMKNLAVYGHGLERFADHLAVTRRVAVQHAKYNPHVSNLGYYIPRFGYETSRKVRLAPEARNFAIAPMMIG